jgi:hypothetical protein
MKSLFEQAAWLKQKALENPDLPMEDLIRRLRGEMQISLPDAIEGFRLSPNEELARDVLVSALDDAAGEEFLALEAPRFQVLYGILRTSSDLEFIQSVAGLFRVNGGAAHIPLLVQAFDYRKRARQPPLLVRTQKRLRGLLLKVRSKGKLGPKPGIYRVDAEGKVELVRIPHRPAPSDLEPAEQMIKEALVDIRMRTARELLQNRLSEPRARRLKGHRPDSETDGSSNTNSL